MSHPKHASADHDVIALIRERWSPRSFDPMHEVARADLLRLFEAARWAPSSANEQPWRFVVCARDAESSARSPYQSLLATLSERNRAWAASAPVLVLVAAKRLIDQFGVDNPHALYDTGQAMGLLTVQATAMGLSMRQIEGFDKTQARDAVHVPPDFDLVVVAAIGYAGDPDGLQLEKHRNAERSPRTRRALTDVVFGGKWGADY